MSAPSSWERALRLYEKNIELDVRKSAQDRVPSDPNVWQQIRLNYEAIILEDQAFSEKHNIESALWHLHYRKIEEFKLHFSAALASGSSNESQGMRGPPRPNRVSKIRQQFRPFLSEATGFYHDLIMKIRAKYGFPLDYISGNAEGYNVIEKDGKKFSDLKKGLISCHRCLIYLGDLARYKGLYGGAQSRSCDFAAADSYYLQAASLWPSSGNPHHQLAILASYMGDELVAVYRYFRSLAVENPFPTARDNLAVAFEKNRHNYLKLVGKVSTTVEEKGNIASVSKDATKKPNLGEESMSTFRSFCTQFVRLNGILFTHTGLETFADVLSSVSNDLCKLLSFGQDEMLIVGADAAENGILIIRIIAILIFTVSNAKRETECQSYAEIVQQAVLFANSFSATFEIMGLISQLCAQLQDPSSSYLFPGITVFVEWLAYLPDILTRGEIDEKQAIIQSNFWNHCISLLNKILPMVAPSISDDVDDSFQDLARYEEGDTGNGLALIEDFELRGFLPLLPAQAILDFSGKHPFGGDGSKQKKARMKRILSAAKALTNVVRVDDKVFRFDSKLKKFLIVHEHQKSDDFVSNEIVLPAQNDMVLENQLQDAATSVFMEANPQFTADIEEEDEVIVFKPSVSEKHMPGPGSTCYENVDQDKIDQNVLLSRVQSSNNSRIIYSSPQHTVFRANTPHASTANHVFPWHPQVSQLHASSCTMGDEPSLLNGFGSLKLKDYGHVTKPLMQQSMGILQSAAVSLPFEQSCDADARPLLYSQKKFPEALAPSITNISPSSIVGVDSLAAKGSTASQAILQKNSAYRPARHMGPPPGFKARPSKQVSAPAAVSINTEMPIVDDYRWLDGYQIPASMKSPRLNVSINNASNLNCHNANNSDGLNGTVSFPVPRKQVPVVMNGMQNQEHLQNLQHVMNGSHQFLQLPEQYQGQPVCKNRSFV